ncbi:hypothetical protein [Nitratireductor sp. XY-223]|uniref:hypothetical protein n=1 Tax=Nitratireductor sp. XY-223 TaxID=2561926 RepID=UPI0010A99AA3|nr:hypothetical protein [Nitratireductor sp. XY-223]
MAAQWSDLEPALLAAHRAGDTRRLAELYLKAGERAEAEGDADKAGFFLVHAYVYALEEGMALASDIHARLKRLGREQ